MYVCIIVFCTFSLQLLPSALEGALSYSLLSHSVSSHLDSSPESSENGTEAPLTPKGEGYIHTDKGYQGQ